MSRILNRVGVLGLAVYLFGALVLSQDDCDQFGTTECSFDGLTGTCTDSASCLTYIIDAIDTDCSCADDVLPMPNYCIDLLDTSLLCSGAILRV